MQQRAFNRHNIDHVQADQRGAKTARKMECVSLRGAGMLGGIDADENSFDHRTYPSIPGFAIPCMRGPLNPAIRGG